VPLLWIFIVPPFTGVRGPLSMKGPESIDDWKIELEKFKNGLGISETTMDAFIADVFIEVSGLSDSTKPVAVG
jgi:hypothetical protein